MKKLLTITIALFTLIFGAISISGQSYKKGKRTKAVKSAKVAPVKKGIKNKGGGLYHGHVNRRGVYTYTTIRIVSRWNGKFKNTYVHKVFPNGRHKVKLVSSERIRPRVYPVNVRFKSQIKYFAKHKYRVIYKITRFSNGYVQKKVHRKKRVW